MGIPFPASRPCFRVDIHFDHRFERSIAKSVLKLFLDAAPGWFRIIVPLLRMVVFLPCHLNHHFGIIEHLSKFLGHGT
jgi:hypothetical protein